MLSPDERRLFLEALKQPEGYRFDRGIGTTFTLNLITLLIIPLSLSMLDRDNIDEMLKDPLILLEGLKRHAKKLTIFCQAGYIDIPPKDNILYSYLEDMIVQVKAPNGGVFHPKIWLLRYTGEDLPVLYRFLSLSRNLTFDRSWDLMVQLDGELAEHRTYGYSVNRPLGKFIEQLPDFSVRPVNNRIKTDIDLMADEVRRVQFKAPQGFEGDPEFYPSGIPGFRGYKFSDPYSRLMLISPFLSNNIMHKVAKNSRNNILISSTAEIDLLSSQAQMRFEKIFVFDEVTDAIEDSETSSGNDNLEGKRGQDKNDASLNGLHAKLFVIESGWDVTWLLGSANATYPAFRNRNVEFMVGLKGKRSKFGIEKILGEEDNEFTLLSLLQPYKQSNQKSETNPEEEKAEKIADQVRRWIVNSEFTLDIGAKPDSKYDMALAYSSSIISPEGDFAISCWPISLPKDYAQEIYLDQTEKTLIFKNLALLTITPFMAFEIIVNVKDETLPIKFVVKLPIINLPANRDNLIVSAIIDNNYQFLRYLRLLLSTEESSIIMEEWFRSFGNSSNMAIHWEDLDFALFEDLLRTLSRSPIEKIDRIAKIVSQIKEAPEAEKIIPYAFDILWKKIISARNELL
jgi:hypothetical protein